VTDTAAVDGRPVILGPGAPGARRDPARPGEVLLTVAAVAAVAAVVAVGTWQSAGHQVVSRRPLDVGAWASAGVAVLSLAGARRAATAALVTAAAATAAYLALRYPYGPVMLTVVVMTHLVTRHGVVRARAAMTGATVLLAAGLLAGLPARTPVAVAYAVLACAVVVGLPAWTGWLARGRMLAQARLLAEQRRGAETADRLRLAREVHDIVGHNLSVISMHAGVALSLSPRRPELAEQALRTVQTVSRQALFELRDTLERLRDGGDRLPLPGLARLPDLVASVTASGLHVELTGDAVAPVPGAAELPSAVDLAAYRIVQEALTNVLRHSSARTARVDVRRCPGELCVEVRDPGALSQAWAPGLGIRGMSERAALLGGRLTAGPDPRGGFAVRAWLPDGAPEPGPSAAEGSP